MKKIILKCTESFSNGAGIVSSRIYKGRIDDAGNVSLSIARREWFPVNKDEFGNLSISGSDDPVGSFIIIKAKTIKCTFVKHSNGGKKYFKDGKRYQVEINRSVGGFAGYIYDEDGDAWQLTRADVGFHCGAETYHFQALYS